MFAKVTTALVLYFLYLFCCFLCTGTDKKNLLGLRSYPDEVQTVVKNEPSLASYLPKEKPILPLLWGNVPLFMVVFSVLGIALKDILGLKDYLSAFVYLLILGEGLCLFDLLVINLLWWRNTKRIRFSFLPEKQAYRNPQKHIGSFLRAIPMFAVVAAISAAIVMLI